MNDPKGFLEIDQEMPERRPVEKRVHDWKEVYKKSSQSKVMTQARRCMDCGVPFCHDGCPLGNLIPEWNELVYNNKWEEAYTRLSRTNNFPEFTGTLCPAPCEPACVLSINAKPVTIKQIELAIIDKAFEEGWVKPVKPAKRNKKKVAVIGSGPAGLAAAQQLNRKGYSVTVFERADRLGGLLRYGIPEFKMEKWRLDRRLDLMKQEEIEFRTKINIGVDIAVKELEKKFDAVVLTIGSTKPRDLRIPGRELEGVHFAMEYLTIQNKLLEEENDANREGVKLKHPPGVKFNFNLNAKDKHVVVIGGGDTGSDCLGTALRQGAKSVTQLQHRPTSSVTRSDGNPWPEWPQTFTVSSSQEEGGKRKFAIVTKEFIGKNGKVRAIKTVQVNQILDENGKRQLVEIPGSEHEIKADLVLLTLGYSGPEAQGIVSQLGINLTQRGSIATDENQMTNIKGVFAAGDASRGQSLIVWAIAEGRKVAEKVDEYLEKI